MQEFGREKEEKGSLEEREEKSGCWENDTMICEKNKVMGKKEFKHVGSQCKKLIT